MSGRRECRQCYSTVAVDIDARNPGRSGRQGEVDDKGPDRGGRQGQVCLSRVTPGEQRLSKVGEKLGMDEITIKRCVLSEKSVRERRERRQRGVPGNPCP